MGRTQIVANLGSVFSGQRKFFSKIDESKDVVGAVPILKILLKGVEMTEKQSFFFGKLSSN